MSSLLLLLLWKNFLIKIRHPIVLIFELALPCLFIALLAYIRLKVASSLVTEPLVFKSFEVDYDFDLFDNSSKLDHKIFYTPSNNVTNRIMQKFAELVQVDSNKTIPFSSESQMSSKYLALNSPEIFCGIVFKHVGNQTLDIKLRFPFSPKQKTKHTFTRIDEITWQTNRLFPLFSLPGPRGRKSLDGGPPSYHEQSFLMIQKALIEAYSSIYVPKYESLEENVELRLQRMPYPPYKVDNYSFALQFFFPIIIMLSFIYPSVNLTKIIVLEKEQRFTSMASMMGLSPSLQWISHFLSAFLFNIISVLVMVAILTCPLGNNMKILEFSDPTLILVWFTLYLVSCIMFCFMISSFFSRANMAGVVSGAVFFLSFLPYYRLNLSYDSTTLVQKLGLSLIFNTNMSLSAMLLSMLECKHLGMRWSYLFETASPDDDLTLFALFCTSIVNSLLYLLVALYVSNVFPGEYGIPRPFYYFLTRDYWFESSRTESIQSRKFAPTLNNPSRNSTTIEMDSLGYKRASLSTSPTLDDALATTIDRVSKTHDNGKTWAVKDFSMKMRQNEITVLLGHNGAGKTTLMSMLCGLIPPTSGDVTIFDMDLRKDIDSIRRDLGICPQFDVLFEDLTVSEHLYFYCVLKRIPKEKIQPEIDSMIRMLDLVPKTNKRSATLSGGMKRKLSVGIALIGGSRFVLLDEATSGMDVSARRFIWDLLIKEKANRAILLSTHFMEEADVLGDKIAIVETGHMKCFGTSMELKKKYGFGYLLKMAIKDSSTEIVSKIQEEVFHYIGDAKCLTQIGNELTFSLPEKQKSKFKQLFTKLEKNSDDLKILSFGISVTTIEEVFLRVGDFAKKGMEQFNEMAKLLNKQEDTHNEVIQQLKPNALKFNSGIVKFIQIFQAMFLKKLNFILHNRFLLIAQFLLPPLVLLLSIINNKDRTEIFSDSPELPFLLKSYKELDFVSFHGSDPTSEHVSELFKKMVSQSGLKRQNFDSVEELPHQNFSVNKHLVDMALKDEVKYNIYNLFGISVHNIHKNTSSRTRLTGLFSNQAYHTVPTIYLMIQQLAIELLSNSTDKLDLKFSNHPFPRKPSEGLTMATFDAARNISICNALTFTVAFLLGSFIILIVNEMVNNFRHIQQISSLDIWLYWATHFVMDYFFWIMSAVVLTFVIYITNVQPFHQFEEISYVFISMVVFGIPALPFTYLLSFMVSDPATGYVRISLFTLILGIVTFVAVIMFRIPEFDLLDVSESVESVLQYILPIFTLPVQIYNVAKSRMALDLCNAPLELFGTNTTLLELCDNAFIIAINPKAAICCEKSCDKQCLIHREYLDWKKPGSLQYLLGYAVQSIFYWTMIAIVEVYGSRISLLCSNIKRLCWKSKPIEHERKHLDEDVHEESDRIRKTKMTELAETDTMWVRGLRKNFGSFTAVDDISFGVKKSECFGILGVNGAGKTTTFKMITGAERITSGDIVINRMNVKHQMSKIFKIIGYCPQFNGLLEELTGRQTLRIISRIRGIYEEMIEKQIDILAKLFFFEEHIDKAVGTYSGGTKRKLSMACSIVGNPKIVFLDEPSTGVDPVSRRCLWNAVQALRAAGSSVVLTSHSMEECEALCNRLIIMVNAKIRCIGSPLHLKDKFGIGYNIQIKCYRKTKKSAIRRLIDHLHEHYDSKCLLESNHNKLLTFKLESKDYQLSEIFGHIEELMQKDEFRIEDYAVNQTSLERIFLSFAREQIENVRPLTG